MRLKDIFRKTKHVKFNEKNNEEFIIDYDYDRTREKMSLKPKSELIKAVIEINEIKLSLNIHKDSLKNTSFKDISLNTYIKYYDDIDDDFKREHCVL